MDEGADVYFDFMKTFDKISHHRLTHKLRMYNIGSFIGKLTESFLVERKWRILITWMSILERCRILDFSGLNVRTDYVLQMNNIADVTRNESSVCLSADDDQMYHRIDEERL